MKNRFSQKKSAYSKFLCYNRLMLKTKTKVKIGFVGILSIAAGVQASAIVANQVSAETSNATFQVNVVESLTVTLTTPGESASGNIKTFLRNKINLAVTTNNTSGFLASMYSDGSTDLTNSTSGSSETIPTMSSDTTRSNVMNTWGYSLGGETWGDTDAGDDTKTYKALSTSLIPVLSSNSAVTGTAATRDIYFGTRANALIPSGTYTGTVIIGVVTGPHDTPVAPANPATDTTPGTATYDSTNNRTVYTATSGTATTTEVSAGDTTNTYNYAPAQGVTERTTASIASGTPLATGLAVTAAVAATSGAIFFILAKRKKDDDDEEDEENMV